MEETPEPFSEVLRRVRVTASLSQEELAERAGISARGVSDLERGLRQTPRPETLRRLIDALAPAAAEREQLVAAARGQSPQTSRPRRVSADIHFPVSFGPLFGRDEDHAALSELLCRSEISLVTVTGTGGVGKTHLAVDVASHLRDRFRDGVFFVDLAPITDPAHVLPAVAGALGVELAPARPVLELMVATLRDRKMLVVVDNCEQVLDAAPQIGRLLAACPGLTMLSTSREALGLRGEREWPLAPLPVPKLEARPVLDDLHRSPSVTLFAARASASDPRFSLTAENAQAVAAICHCLDGLPLAIELAAARVKLLTPDELAFRLSQRLPMLTGGTRDAPMRQRTLRDTIAWSYDLLAPDEQGVFRSLGVFVGGWSAEAAEEVVELAAGVNVLDRLGSLLDKSLVRVDKQGDSSRFGMLETIREFALERLVLAGENEIARQRHAVYFLRLAEIGAEALEGPRQRRWLSLLKCEHHNLREALTTFETIGDREGYQRLATALSFFWFAHAHAAEGLLHLRRVLAATSGATIGHAKTLLSAGSLAYAVGDYADAQRWLQECERLARSLDERYVLASALLTQGAVAEHLDDDASAEFFFRSALVEIQESGPVWLTGEALPNLSDVAYRRGDLELAERYAREGFASLAESGNVFMESMNWGCLGQAVLAKRDIGSAAAAFGEALRIAEEIESSWNVANAILGASAVATARGKHALAARLLGAADAAREASGHMRFPQFFLFAQTRTAVADLLGPDRFHAAWDAGQALPGEDAVAAARAALADAASAG